MASFALPADLAERVAALATDLDSYLNDARSVFDERSDRWRDSDAGIAADGWLGDIEAAVDTLEALPARPE